MGDASAWRTELDRWLEPFLAELNHAARRTMCPHYVAGLIGLGERKSMQPMAARHDGLSYDRLQHFISVGRWDDAPLARALLAKADRMVGGRDAVLVIDDTSLPKKGRHSVGVAPQYLSAACFCGVFRSATNPLSRTRSSGETETSTPRRMPAE